MHFKAFGHDEDMHALIAEDEPHLAADLERRVQRLWPELHISVVHDGLAARDYLNATPPDMAFLDIRMPGLSGLEAALAAPPGCRVVFVTAYDEHAVAAFEQAATDYLLKPVSDARLEKSLARLRQAKPTGDTQAILASTRSLLDQLREQLSVTAAADRYLSLLRVQVGLDLQLIPVEDVSHFLATEKYTTAYTRQREYLLRTPSRI